MEPKVEVAEQGSDVAPRGRGVVALGVGAGLVALGLGAGWIERRPIVARFADRALADAHVPARYRIAAIGPFTQRLEEVRLGDPAAPDLTARVVELRLGYGLGGPHLVAVRGEGVRLAARVVDGRLLLGAIDRLLSKTGAPPVLPDIDVTLADTRIALATPAGAIDVGITGSGNLADGFRGTLAARADGLRAGGCRAARPVARFAVRIVARRPIVSGPIDLAGLACGTKASAGAGRATIDLAFAESLDRWRGGAILAGFAGGGAGVRFGALTGHVGVIGDRRRLTGAITLAAAGIATEAGKAARAALAGRYRYAAGGGLVFAGDVALGHAMLADTPRQRLIAAGHGLVGTPVGPLAARAIAAADALLGDAAAHATVALSAGGPTGLVARVGTLDLAGGEDSHIRLAGGNGIGWTGRGWRIDSRLESGGGGLPNLDIRLAQHVAGGAISGVATMAPYAAGGARLAITPARFVVAPDGGIRFDTVATLDGAIGSGRFEGLTVPLAGRIDSRGGVVLGEGCLTVGLTRLALAGVTLDPARFPVCGIDGAPIVASPGGTVRAGITLADVRLTGRSGRAPLAVSAKAARLAGSGIAVAGLSVTLGRPDAPTTLDVATLAGTAGAGGFTGIFADASGRIGHVPVLLSGAGGDWRLAGGVLTLAGALTVADADPAPRFLPLAARGVALRFADGRIDATGALHEPRSGALVSNVAIRHDLATGAGGVVLDVPALGFAEKGLQPEALTPLTLGVIANVAGVAKGRGTIDWSARGVASAGDFRTDGIDLAAAFGPVRQIAGAIHFSDLLGMVSPPRQAVTIAELNPGIAVTGGIVHYQLLGPNRFQVEDARWPFAGGTLALDHSLLAFGLSTERHLTFRVAGVDAAAFIQQLDFPNITATGTFDGVLPMVFDDSGGRIAGGLVSARKGGGTLAYVGELTNAQIGTMGKFAFDALKAIRYKSLSIGLDGRLDGEIVSNVRFEGVRQATGDAGMIARMIYNLPFRFNIAIRAPFRGLMGSARSYADPNLLLNGGLPITVAPVSAPPAAIQSIESESMR
ncbi:MAG TPA: YdbH domain-containing protein [Sphingomonas sp.]